MLPDCPCTAPVLQVLIREIPEAKEMGLAQLCEFIEVRGGGGGAGGRAGGKGWTALALQG